MWNRNMMVMVITIRGKMTRKQAERMVWWRNIGHIEQEYGGREGVVVKKGMVK
jgi:hypothetical protein